MRKRLTLILSVLCLTYLSICMVGCQEFRALIYGYELIDVDAVSSNGGEGLLFGLNSDGTAIVVDITDEDEEKFIIPDTIYNENHEIKVTKIREACFQRCTNIKYVTIGNNVEEIPDYAFARCSNLKTVLIGSGVQSIGDDAFQYCKNLESIYFPKDTVLKTIGNFAFDYCSKLTTISLESQSSLESIGFRAFSYCTNLESISFEGTALKTIGNFAFFDCTSLTTVTFNDSLKTIGKGAFQACSSLKNNVEGGTTFIIPESVTEIGESAFHNAALIEVTLPSGLRILSPSVFAACYNLETINFPTSLSSIGTSAFERCKSLKIIDLSDCDSLITIGINAFISCKSATAIKISDSVTAIGAYAFADCTNVKSITIGSGIKDSGKYYGIGQAAFRACGSEIEALTVTFSSENNNPLTIGGEAFKGTSLQEITIPDNVTAIEDIAFKNCRKLTTVRIGSGIRSNGIFPYAFDECESLTTIYIDSQSVADLKNNESYLFTNATTVYCLNNGTTVITPSSDSYITNNFQLIEPSDESNYAKYSKTNQL